MAELREYLELKANLSRQGVAIHEIRDAAVLGAGFEAAGLDWEQVRGVAKLIAALEAAGIELSVPENLQEALADYEALGYDAGQLTILARLWQRLQAHGITLDDLDGKLSHLDALQTFGLDEDTTHGLAEALNAAGISHEDRTLCLQRVVAIGCGEAERVRLEQKTERLACEVATAQDSVREARRALTEIKAEVAHATQERDRMRQEIGILDEQGDQRYEALVAAEALEHLLLGHTSGDDPFWRKLEQLLWLKRNGTPGRALTEWLTTDLRQAVRGFLDQLATTPAESSGHD